MTREHWERIRKVFDSALERPAGDRARFVAEACGTDIELIREIESLLEGNLKADDFIFDLGARTFGQELDSASQSRVFKEGEIISERFKILRFVGKGGMGEVYEAEDVDLRRRVALKTVRPDIAADPRMLMRFLREIKLALRVNHPNVCRIHDLERHRAGDGSSPAITYLTMEMLEGETLAQRLKRQGRLTPEEAYPLICQMAEGLAAAHDADVIHRDFKPANVILVPKPSGEKSTPPNPEISPHRTTNVRAVVTDFGLARSIAASASTDGESASIVVSEGGQILGTPGYMAPEQFYGGEITPATDVYAFGVVIYEMISGKLPYPPADTSKRFKKSPPSLRSVSPDSDPQWDSAILQCLESDPNQRFQSCHELIQVLQNENPPPRKSERARPGLGPVTYTRSLIPAAIANHLVIATTVFLLAVLAPLVWYFRFDPWAGKPQIATGATVLLTNISNVTGDPELDGVTEVLRNALAQSAHFNLMEKSRVCEVLQRMTKSCEPKLDPAVAREVAMRDGVPRVIFGSLSRVGENYSLDLEIDKPDTEPTHPRTTWSNHWTAASKQELFRTIRDASDWVRRTTGEASGDLNEASYARRPEDITTDSWESLGLYARGEELKAKMKYDPAVLLYRQAIDKDPQFAMAYMRLGDILLTLNRSHEGYQYWQKALDVSSKGPHHLTQKEELRIRGEFAMDRWDFEEAVRNFQTYAVQYPNDYLGFFMRAPSLVMLYEAPDPAIGALLEADQKPNAQAGAFFIQSHLARYYLIAGDSAKALDRITRLRKTGRNDYADAIEGQARFLEGNYQRADELFAGLRKYDNRYLRSASYCLQANLRSELGQYSQALKVLDEGIQSDALADLKVQQADKLLAVAYLRYRQRKQSAARSASLQAVRLDSSLERSLLAGTLLARSGYPADAEDVLNKLDPVRYPPISDIVRWRLRGEILMARNKACEALTEFEKSDQAEAKAHPREYLARAELACNEPTATSRLRKDRALLTYKTIVMGQGRFWYQGEDSLPGLWSDMLYQYARLGLQLRDPEARPALERYLKLRAPSDPDLPDVRDATELKGSLAGTQAPLNPTSRP